MVRIVVLNATCNNILAMSWWEETGVPEKNHRPAASQWQTVSHNIVSSTPRNERDSNTTGDRH
jgi:hypothetical protein